MWGQVVGLESVLLGSRRHVSFLKGHPWCVVAGGGEQLSNLGIRSACHIFFRRLVVWGD